MNDGREKNGLFLTVEHINIVHAQIQICVSHVIDAFI